MTYKKEKIKLVIDKAYDAQSANATIAFSTLAIAMILYNKEEGDETFYDMVKDRPAIKLRKSK
jgi:hypothetical protein